MDSLGERGFDLLRFEHGREPYEGGISISVRKRRLRLNRRQPCGLQDLIFAATLIRIAREREDSDLGRPDALAEATWHRLDEALPQALTYSTAAEIRTRAKVYPVCGKRRDEGDEIGFRVA